MRRRDRQNEIIVALVVAIAMGFALVFSIVLSLDENNKATETPTQVAAATRPTVATPFAPSPTTTSVPPTETEAATEPPTAGQRCPPPVLSWTHACQAGLDRIALTPPLGRASACDTQQQANISMTNQRSRAPYVNRCGRRDIILATGYATATGIVDELIL